MIKTIYINGESLKDKPISEFLIRKPEGPKNNVFSVEVNEAKRTIFVKLGNGLKAVVRCHPEDEFDIELGTALAICRAVYGSKSKFRKLINQNIKYIKKEKKDESRR